MTMAKTALSKGLALLVALLLLVGGIVGCSSKEPTSSTSGGKTQTTGSAGEATEATDPGTGETEETGETGATGDQTNATGKTEKPVNGKTDKPVTNKTTSKGGTPTQKPSDGKFTVTKGNEFPIVKNGKLTLSIMMPKQTGAPANFDNISFTKEYEKKTGIDIKYLIVNEGDQFTKKQTALSSGNLPNIFAMYGAVFTAQEVYQYAREKTFVALNDYLNDYGTNILKTFNDVPNARKSSTMGDGKIYGLPGVSGEGWGQTWTINKKWLDELGLAIPTTTDEFYNVLKAFKTKDPNGNGKKDEEAFAMWEWHPNIWNPWGLNMGWYNKISADEKGKIYYAPMTDQFREGIRFWKKCYDEGLIYKRALGTGYSDFESILAEGKVGCFVWPWPENVFKESQLDDYIPFAMPKGNNTGNFKAGVSPYSEGISQFRFIITKTCPNVAAAVRFLDYFYSIEGNLLKTYGAPGKYYVKVGSKYKFMTAKENTLTYGLGDQIAGNARIPESMVYQKHESEMTAVEKYTKKKQALMKQYFTPGNPKYTTEQILLNEAEAKKAKEYMDAVGDAYNWGIQAIMGTKNVETDWNTFINTYKSKGADEMVKIYQTAFDRQFK